MSAGVAAPYAGRRSLPTWRTVKACGRARRCKRRRLQMKPSRLSRTSPLRIAMVAVWGPVCAASAQEYRADIGNCRTSVEQWVKCEVDRGRKAPGTPGQVRRLPGAHPALGRRHASAGHDRRDDRPRRQAWDLRGGASAHQLLALGVGREVRPARHQPPCTALLFRRPRCRHKPGQRAPMPFRLCSDFA